MIAVKVKNLSKIFYIADSRNSNFLHENVAKYFLKLFSNSLKKSEYVALQDISFSIERGDIIGVIGPNGAGKSTLLKILARIVNPTRGEIEIVGKTASILEVGTGFHPELTGKENIFLNGAILGMSKKEILEKYKDIVEFSNIKEFINVPVKYYSSGMMVRLAFSVAAYLDSDVLLMDEVLAVGDLKFQKKCLNKMSEITRETNRTIIFVSHNMEAVNKICNKVIWIEKGEIKEIGETSSVVNSYIASNQEISKNIEYNFDKAPGNECIKIKKFAVESKNNTDKLLTVNTALELCCEFWSLKTLNSFNVSLFLYNAEQCIFNSASPVTIVAKGKNRFACSIPGGLLNDGNYYAKILFVDNSSVIYELEEMCQFNLVDEREHEWYGKWGGVIRPKLDWEIKTDLAQ